MHPPQFSRGRTKACIAHHCGDSDIKLASCSDLEMVVRSQGQRAALGSDALVFRASWHNSRKLDYPVEDKYMHRLMIVLFLSWHLSAASYSLLRFLSKKQLDVFQNSK